MSLATRTPRPPPAGASWTPRRRSPGALGASLAVSLVAGGARGAGPFSAFGHDADALGVAASGIAFGRTGSLAHANPAALAGVPEQLEVVGAYLGPRLHVTPMPRAPGSEVPISVYDSTLGTDPRVGVRPLPTAELPAARSTYRLGEPEGWLGLGLVTDLGLRRLRVGGVLLVPVAQATAASVTTHFSDEREAGFSNQVRFTRFGDWTRVTALVAGVAYRPVDFLDVGVGTQFGVAAVARLGVYVPDAARQDRAISNLSAEIATRWRPVAGVRATLEPLQLGLVFRGESAFEVEGRSVVRLWNAQASDPEAPAYSVQRFPIVVGFEPLEVGCGGSLALGDARLQVGVTYQRWSDYRDHHGERPEDAALAAPGDRGRWRFSDTLVRSAGFRYAYHRSAELLLGVTHQPTPVPPQVGRTSYADSDVVGVTLGQRVEVHAFSRAFRLSASGGAFVLGPRTVHKDPSLLPDEVPDDTRTLTGNQAMPEARGLQTNSPGYPGYRLGGHVVTAMFGVSHEF